MKKRLKNIDQKIEQYLEELDAVDEEEADIHKPTAEELREKIERLKESARVATGSQRMSWRPVVRIRFL